MLKNYFKVAIRNLFRYKFYSIINILGLAIGITCFLFILIYVTDELSYDRYHAKAERTYRVDFEGIIFEQEMDISEAPDPLGPTVLSDFPEVEQQVRLRDRGSFLLRYEENSYREEDIIFADSTLFDVFSFKLLQGDPKTVLAEPNTLVLTPSIARKYFGSEDPVGKSLILDNDQNYRVAGIMEEMPENTHFNYNIIASLSSLDESRAGQWVSFNFHTYLVLKEGVDPASVEAKFPKLTETYIGSQLEQFMGISFEDFLAGGNRVRFYLFPLTKIHLYSHKFDELAPAGDIKYVYIFSFIGFFILLLACINFMNLSTARSAQRAKEVGLRKVVGARRRQLIAQFLSESVIISFLALIISVAILQLLLPYFNELSGKELSSADINQGWLWTAMLLLTLVVGIIAGSYPAFFLSAFEPVATMKGLFGVTGRSVLRNTLVVFQFAITIILIVGTLVIYNQLNYIRNKKLGFNKEQLLILNDAYALSNNLLPFKETITDNPQLISASVSSCLPTPSSRNSTSYFLGRNPGAGNSHILQSWTVDYDYIKTLDMEIVEGRDFSRDFATDSTAIIINESSARIFGLQDPLGKEISTYFGSEPGALDIITSKVIGVVKDFHFESLRDKIGPLVMRIGDSRGYMVMKVKTDNIEGFIKDLQREWNRFAPNQPFAYSFMDDKFDSMYTAETRIGSILSVFTFLAVFIACLGLFGLATFTTEQRTKEIGIRKILGAPVARLFLLLTAEFTKWVLIANVVALPLAYYGMKKWLQGFEYQVGIGAGTLILALILGLIIALLTVSYQAIRASSVNPVDSLRYE